MKRKTPPVGTEGAASWVEVGCSIFLSAERRFRKVFGGAERLSHD